MSLPSTYKALLDTLISFKSISTDVNYKGEILKTVSYLTDIFEHHKFETEVIDGYGNPIVYASHKASEEAETCLIYGHYDVQPADIADGWDADPFTVKETPEKLIARGIVDNKGQTLIHIATVLDLIMEGKLKYNIKFMLEGDEETGSPKLPDFVRDYKEKLACDFYLISDGTIIGDYPVIEASFRGGFNAKLTIRTAHTDMHSGIYGGAVPNSAHELSNLLSKLYDENHKIAIPGFYDDVIEVTDAERVNNEALPFDMNELNRITGVKEVLKDNGYDYYTASALRPTVEVTGIQSGYTGVGFRNSIAASSEVRINFRLVDAQKPETIIKLFEDFIKANIPSYVDYALETADLHLGVKLDLKNKFVEDARKSLEKTFGKRVYNVYSGGGLPIVTLFKEFISPNGVLVPLGNEDCNMHAVGENYSVDILKKGLDFSKNFFSN